MQQVTATIIAVNELTSSKTGKKFWKAVAADNQEYAIWDAPLAQTATALLNQQAHLTFTSRQNGQFVNHSLTGIAAASGVLPAQNGGAVTSAPAPAASHSKADQFRTPEQIIRQEAIHAACRLHNSEVPAHQIRNTIEEFVYYSQHGRWMDTEIPVAPVAGDGDWA